MLGVRPNSGAEFMTQSHFGLREKPGDDVDTLHRNLTDYLRLCEDNGYGYDFIVAAVSGVFSDNAPPETLILRVVEEYGRRYGGEVEPAHGLPAGALRRHQGQARRCAGLSRRPHRLVGQRRRLHALCRQALPRRSAAL